MPKQTKRENFPERIRKLAAMRAAFRCSVPQCDRVTIGPGATADQTASIGVASHIFSASPGGPRGTGGLNNDELRSIENAIWLCEVHGKLVDTNKGNKYPAELLLSYRALHEAKIAREMQGTSSCVGWVDELRVHSSPLFADSASIKFGKLTLFVGLNATGKTALCEWIAGMCSTSYLERWQNIMNEREGVEAELTYSDPEPHSARFSFLSSDFPRYRRDDKPMAIPVTPLKVVFPEGHRSHSDSREVDDVDWLARQLGLDDLTIYALASDIGRNGTGYVIRPQIVEEPDGRRLRINGVGADGGQSLRGLPGSVHDRVLMEFAIAAAAALSEQYPTMLILDDAMWHLDTEWLKKYGKYLASPSVGFQTVATIPKRDIDMDALRWAGWTVVNLSGAPPDVTLTSDVRAD